MCVCEDVTPAVWAATSRWFIRFPSAPGCLCYANKVFVCVIVYVSGRSSPTLKGFVRIAGICYVMLYVWEHSVTCGIPCKWGYGRCITYFHVCLWKHILYLFMWWCLSWMKNEIWFLRQANICLIFFFFIVGFSVWFTQPANRNEYSKFAKTSGIKNAKESGYVKLQQNIVGICRFSTNFYWLHC